MPSRRTSTLSAASSALSFISAFTKSIPASASAPPAAAASSAANGPSPTVSGSSTSRAVSVSAASAEKLPFSPDSSSERAASESSGDPFTSFSFPIEASSFTRNAVSPRLTSTLVSGASAILTSFVSPPTLPDPSSAVFSDDSDASAALYRTIPAISSASRASSSSRISSTCSPSSSTISSSSASSSSSLCFQSSERTNRMITKITSRIAMIMPSVVCMIITI